MSVEAFETYFPTWLHWIGTGRRFLPEPGGLANQLEVEMTIHRTLDSIYEKMLSQARTDV